MDKVFWTSPALKDLREIVEFISKDSLVYAERIGTQLVQSTRRLSIFPLSGRIVPEFSDETLREIICGSYRIIYKLSKKRCFIVAVIHASRDILTSLTPGEWNIL